MNSARNENEKRNEKRSDQGKVRFWDCGFRLELKSAHQANFTEHVFQIWRFNWSYHGLDGCLLSIAL